MHYLLVTLTHLTLIKHFDNSLPDTNKSPKILLHTIDMPV